MNDHFAFIAYGNDDLYHRGALFSALRLLYFCPGAKIRILTDRPSAFTGYPVETVPLSTVQKDTWSFANRYHFGIKAAGIIELLKGCDRLFFMDTDMYAVGDISRVFDRISPTHSVMRFCEGKSRADYSKLAGAGISLGGRALTGAEPMWNSGLLGVHRTNLAPLQEAYSSLEQVCRVVSAHARTVLRGRGPLGWRTLDKPPQIADPQLQH